MKNPLILSCHWHPTVSNLLFIVHFPLGKFTGAVSPVSLYVAALMIKQSDTDEELTSI